MDPASPSRLVPGAWPASPSPSRHRCGSTTGPHLRRHVPSLTCHKINPRRVIHSYFDSKSALATPTADSTPTSFTFDDLSLQSSLAGTSISSAYMDPFLENSTSKPEQDGSPQSQGGTFDRCQSSSPERVYCESPSPLGDQTYLSLPEIPDLSFLSSLQENSHTTGGNFNTSNNEPSFLSFDENILETQTSSCGGRSSDTLSSSSIRFRRSEVPPLEWATQNRPLPQLDDRNSWSLFLSPVSASSQERSSLPLQLIRNRLGIQMSESVCQDTDPAYTNVIRRSWIIGNYLPGSTKELPEEEESIRRYANEILDEAFHMDADGSVFTLGIPGVYISPNNPPLEVVANPQRRVKFSRIAKRLVHRILNKGQNEGTIQENPTNEGPEPIRHVRHGLYLGGLKLQVRDSVLPHGSPGSQGQTPQACKWQDAQSDKDDSELRVREFKLGGIKMKKFSAVSSTPGAPFRHPIGPSLQHLPAIPGEGPHKTTSENQHFLSCDIFKLEKPKRSHRRSFLRRVGI